MIHLRKLTQSQIDAFLDRQSNAPFSYSAVGATRGQPPAGYDVDHHRVRLGTSQATYKRACAAVRAWRMFDVDWLHVHSRETLPEVGATVGIFMRTLGLWTANACRIVYVLDETGPTHRYGFANGTLGEHMEEGEERFSVEWHTQDDSVWYDILVFSRPSHILTRLGYRFARRTQKRFAKDSLAAMKRRVSEL